MRYQLTPAAERALALAALWRGPAATDEIETPELLLALAAEPECRAALLLAEHGVDEPAIRRQWPELEHVDHSAPQPRRALSPRLDAALRAADARLFDYPRPLALATEHLLLGLVAAEGAVSNWLRSAGLDPDALESDIRRRAGHDAGPLSVDFLDEQNETTDVENSSATYEQDAAAYDADDDDSALEELPQPPPHEQIAILRVIDAAANRAGEGLRVIEDYLRFALDDVFLTRHCKQLRHELAGALVGFPLTLRHAARETRADVGAEVKLSDERDRTDLQQVLTASFKRVEQALRTLEEYTKITDPVAAAKIERLRYRTYTLERVADIGRESLSRLATARLYVLIDGGRARDEFARLVDVLASSLVGAGVHVIQLRDKNLPDRELLDRARLLAELTRETETLFIMNDRADLARLAGADGVHLGQEELSVKDARTILGPRALIGVSTHSIEQARQAVLDGANYIGVGPTFSSATKTFDHFPGVELLRQVAAEIRLPAFAIGGINAENLPEVLTAGIRRVAVSSAVAAAPDPATAARQLLALLD